jgi:hypothetical protein
MNFVRDGGAKEGDLDQVLLRVLSPLADLLWDLASLANANANVALAVTNDDECGEGEAATALNDLRHAINLHDLLGEGQL